MARIVAQPVALPDPFERRMIRLRARWTIQDVARAVGCSVGSVSYWERGSEPRGDKRARYAQFLAQATEIAQLVGL